MSRGVLNTVGLVLAGPGLALTQPGSVHWGHVLLQHLLEQSRLSSALSGLLIEADPQSQLAGHYLSPPIVSLSQWLQQKSQTPLPQTPVLPEATRSWLELRFSETLNPLTDTAFWDVLPFGEAEAFLAGLEPTLLQELPRELARLSRKNYPQTLVVAPLKAQSKVLALLLEAFATEVLPWVWVLSAQQLEALSPQTPLPFGINQLLISHTAPYGAPQPLPQAAKTWLEANPQVRLLGKLPYLEPTDPKTPLYRLESLPPLLLNALARVDHSAFAQSWLK